MVVFLEDVTIFEGDTGEWKGWQEPASTDNLYACGAELQVEDYVGQLSDDTAVNGLRLIYCNIDDWNIQEPLTIYEGTWGDWIGPKLCSENYYVDGGQVQHEDLVGAADATGVNGLKIRCRSKFSGQVEWQTVHSGRYGSDRKQVFREDAFVSGANVRYHNPCGTFCDDTALNGIKFRFKETPSVAVVPTATPEMPVPSENPTAPPAAIPQESSSSNSMPVVLGASIAAGLLVLLFVLIVCFLRMKRPRNDIESKRLDEQGTSPSTSANDMEDIELGDDLNRRPDVDATVLETADEVDDGPEFKDQVQSVTGRNIPMAKAVVVKK